MKRLMLLPLLFSLSGCLLTQTDPATQKGENKGFLLGMVTVEDKVIANTGSFALLQAIFALKNEPKKKEKENEPIVVNLETTRNRAEAVARFMANDTRGAACQKSQSNQPPADPSKPRSEEGPALISVGALGFGPVLQGTLQILQPTQEHTYGTMLEPGIPAGAYQVASQGTPDAPPISEILSMPEELEYVRLNGRDMGDPTAAFKPDQGMEVFWKEPSISNDQNAIFLQFKLKDALFNVYEVNCQLREEGIPSLSGYKSWKLDKTWFEEFPVSGTFQSYVIRAHSRAPETKTSQIKLQGLRTVYSTMPIKP